MTQYIQPSCLVHVHVHAYALGCTTLCLGYRGKQLRVFHFGDYQYLSIIYGISGASGMYSIVQCILKLYVYLIQAATVACFARLQWRVSKSLHKTSLSHLNNGHWQHLNVTTNVSRVVEEVLKMQSILTML